MKKSLFLLLLAVAVTKTTAQVPAMLNLVGSPVWEENFSNSGGSLNSNAWTMETGNGNWGWGNGEVQNYSTNTNNIKVQNGEAVITARGGSGGFTSARIKTQGKVLVKYGSIEARIKLPNLSDGLWPAFWLLGESFDTVGWPKCGEIDILEAGAAGSIQQGKVNRVVSSAAHWDASGYASYGLELDVGSDFTNKYQTYRMDWTPEAINTFVDGKFIWAFDIGSCRNTHCAEFHEPFFFIANMAIGGRFTGIMDANLVTATTPAEMFIDYIRVYNNERVNAQVTGGGINQAPPNSAPTDPPTASPTPPPTSTPPPTPPPTPSPVQTNVTPNSITCGVPSTCTNQVLNTDADGFTCLDRINYYISLGRNENYACDTIARKEFPTQCGGCDPQTGAPFINYNGLCGGGICNDIVLNHLAPYDTVTSPTCGERVLYKMQVEGWSEADACRHVAGVEFPFECGECVQASITCGKSSGDSCLSKLDQVSNTFTCRERISWVVYATNKTELEACSVVANEAGNKPVCGDCDPAI